MDVTQWVILGLAISAVLGIYLYTRRNDGPNPWREMGDADGELPEDSVMKDASGREVLIDPSVAGEWSDFTPERVSEPRPVTPKPDVDDISPAKLQRAEAESPSKQASREAAGFDAPVSQPAQLQPKSAAPVQEAPAAPGEQKIVVLHIVGREQATFAGTQIHKALTQGQLEFGPRDVYHRMADIGGRPESVFSIANMLKPGTLDPSQAEELATKGLVMFMVLPGPVDGNKAFHDMLQTAQDLATQLGGVVLDDKRLPLTRQAAQSLIDDIAQAEKRHRMARG